MLILFSTGILTSFRYFNMMVSVENTGPVTREESKKFFC